MRFIFGLVLISVASVSGAEAKNCDRILAAVLSTAAATSIARGDIVDYRPRWPFETATYITPMPKDMTITESVANAHERYQNLFYYEGLSAVYNPNYFSADSMLPTNVGSIWLATDGAWNSVTMNAPSEMPFQFAFGTQVIYDQTPHTPGLYQFTTINWANFPFTITVTHHAWVLVDPMSLYRYGEFNDSFGYQSVSSIPSAGGLTLLGAAGILAGSKSRRR